MALQKGQAGRPRLNARPNQKNASTDIKGRISVTRDQQRGHSH